MSRPQNDVQDERLRIAVLSQAKTIEDLTSVVAAQAATIASQEKRVTKLDKRARKRSEELKAANARIAALEAALLSSQDMFSPDRPGTRLVEQRQVTLSPFSTNPSSPTGALPAIAVSDSELPLVRGDGTARYRPDATDPQRLSARADAPSLRSNHFRFLRQEERYAATPAPSPASLPTTAQALDTPRAGPRVSSWIKRSNQSERPDTASLAGRTDDAPATLKPKA